MTNWLIVGLGNPGREYEDNRHNVGFMAVDALVEKYGTGGDKNVFQSVVRTALIDDQNVLTQKPQTFMNISGEAVGMCARFYKIPLENVIVIHDDLDLEAGTVRVKQGGGAGGHNGLKSIDHLVGNNYWRIRIGIGHPGDKNFVSSYVLNDFANDEWEWVGALLKKLTDNFPLMLKGQSSKLQTLFNDKTAEKNIEKKTKKEDNE
jgi:PTH1 family peptidyl-tRNA hydrolase